MKPRKAALFALAQESEKQDRSDNVTGQRRENDDNGPRKQREEKQGSQHNRKEKGPPRRPVRGSEGRLRALPPESPAKRKNARKRQRPSSAKVLRSAELLSSENLCAEHFGKFHEEVGSVKRARLFDSEAIRHECVRTFAKFRHFRHKPKNKISLKRRSVSRSSAKNLLK
jgi:hypothetical protein